MSLINDALKKARQSQQQKPSAMGAEHFRPIESGRQRSNLVFLLPIAIVFLSAAGGVLVWLALHKSGVIHREAALAKTKPSTEQTENTTTAAQPSLQTNPTVAVSPQKMSAQNPNSVPSNPDEMQLVAARQTDASQAQNTIAAAAPKPVVPTLRGIFYNPSRPSAVLNTRTVFVGESIGGFRVLAITLNSVTVENGGQTNVLTLAE